MFTSKLKFVLIAATAIVSQSFGDISVPGVFSHHMVLQRGIRVPVWGTASENEVVAVELGGVVQTTNARDGKWMVYLNPLPAGGPHVLTIRGRNMIVLTNVLVGEVWVCSGQSNMEFPLSKSDHPQEDIEESTHPKLRLFTVPKRKANQPQHDVPAQWQESHPGTTPNFSAVAYYFGKDLQKSLGVPVGLIHTSWGGSPAEVWIRQEILEGNAEYKKDILEFYAPQEKKFLQDLAGWEKEDAALKADGKKITRPRPRNNWKPSELYNGMISPLLPFGIRGALWYQGESNAGRAGQYRRLFPDMIRNWRTDWNQGDFPFLAVQLAPWDKNRKRTLEEISASPGESDWAELREAQMLATQSLPKVGVAVITDVGDKDDIHPVKKQPVGARLALLARKIAYGEKLTSSGPTYKSSKIKNGSVMIHFENTGKGLEVREGPLKGFSIAGEDKKFVWADARIKGDQVIVSSPQIASPAAVRYGWADYPVVNLWNKSGLPASPFRTDDWPLTTQKK